MNFRKLLFAAALSAAAGQAQAQIWGPVVGGLVNGGVVYGAGGIVAQDSTRFFWDGTNHRLGIGNATPTTALDVTGTATIQTLVVSGVSTFSGSPLSVSTASGPALLNATRATQATGQVGVSLSTTSGGVPWLIYQPGSSNTLTWNASAADIMTLTSGGNLGVTGTLAVTGQTNLSTKAAFTGAVASGPASGTGYAGADSTNGMTLIGRGSAADVTLQNYTGTVAAFVPTGTQALTVNGTLTVAGGVVSTTLGAAVSLNVAVSSTYANNFSYGLKIGGTVGRATTEGTNKVDIYDGTAPVGTMANGISLYSTAGELRVMDAAGNATLLSPHDKKTNEWIYDSVVSTTGRRLRIDMEQMMKFLNNYHGTDFIKEFTQTP